MKSVTDLITAIASLVGALAWPALALFVIIRFRVGLDEFTRNLGEFGVKGPGIEAFARRQQIEAAVAVGAALATAPGGTDDPQEPARAAAELAEALPGKRVHRALQGAVALWVDDRPQNNRYERQALEALGVIVSTSTSTDEALDQLSRRPVDVVISDMGRPPDSRAAYTLLDAMRGRGDQTPFVIYASSRSAEHKAEARAHGAVGCTNSPQELIALVTQALGQRRSR